MIRRNCASVVTMCVNVRNCADYSDGSMSTWSVITSCPRDTGSTKTF